MGYQSVWFGSWMLFAPIVFGLLSQPAAGFEIVWNGPTDVCKPKFNVDLNFDKAGILYNKVHRTEPLAKGDHMIIFYERELGIYPQYENGEEINCGMPQCVNITAHKVKMVKEIKKMIPDKDFDGNAVINWEAWRFSYLTNWHPNMKIYKTRSLEMARQAYKDITDEKRLNKKAEEMFNKASKRLVLATLNKAKSMRPKAKWGFYKYPECFWMRNDSCNGKDATVDERWVYEASTDLYPTIYIKPFTKILSSEERLSRVTRTMEEMLRVTKNIDVSIYPYTKVTYDPHVPAEELDFYTLEDLCLTYSVPASYDMDGLIVWSNSASLKTKERCLRHQKYFDKTFIPFINTLREHLNDCPKRNGPRKHGRCFTVTCDKNGATYHKAN